MNKCKPRWNFKCERTAFVHYRHNSTSREYQKTKLIRSIATYDCCVFSNSTDSTSSFIWAFRSSSSDPFSSSLSGFGLGSGVIWEAGIALGAVDGRGDKTDVCKKSKKFINIMGSQNNPIFFFLNAHKCLVVYAFPFQTIQLLHPYTFIFNLLYISELVPW